MRVLDNLKQFGSQSVARTRFHGRRPGLVYVLRAALFDDLRTDGQKSLERQRLNDTAHRHMMSVRHTMAVRAGSSLET